MTLWYGTILTWKRGSKQLVFLTVPSPSIFSKGIESILEPGPQLINEALPVVSEDRLTRVLSLGCRKPSRSNPNRILSRRVVSISTALIEDEAHSGFPVSV